MKALQLTLLMVASACSFALVILTITNLDSLIEMSDNFMPVIMIFVFSIVGAFTLYLFLEEWYKIFLK